jgi:hypothetical protein
VEWDAFIAGKPQQRLAQELNLPRKYAAMHADRKVRMHGNTLDGTDPAVHRFRNQPVYLFARAHSRALD